MAYASFFGGSPYQAGPDPRLFGGNGPYGMPAGGMGLPGMPFGGPATPYGAPSMGGAPGGAPGGQGGGWLGALSRFTGFNDMSGLERAYMLASVGGGVADYFERQGEKKEEKRRYEQALEESERHRRRMGENLNRVWGG